MAAIRQFTVTAAIVAAFTALVIGAWQFAGTIGKTDDPVPAIPLSSPVSGEVSPDDAPFVLNTAAAVWDTRAREAGGAITEVTFQDDLTADVALAPNGDFTATTNQPSEPQWIHIGSTVYGRLGQEELNANAATLKRLGKADATWTDAALLGEERRLIFSLADMDKTVRSVAEVGVAFRPETVDGRTFIATTVPWTAFPELEALLPYQGSVEVVVTLGPDRLPERITFSVADQRVATVSLKEFAPVAATAPPADQVITMEDLIVLTGALDDTATAPPTTPSAP